MHQPALDIEALLTLHHQLFGDARMDATDPEDPDADPTDPADPEDPDADPTDPADPDAAAEAAAAAAALGDKGKQALDRMKAKVKAERDRNRDLAAELAKLKAPKAGDEPNADALRADADRAATARANERILRSEIRAAAAGKLQDPKDALAHLDMSKFEVDEDGGVDEDEIAEAIEELIKRKPYLAVAQGDKKTKVVQGSADAGNRGGKAAKPQLTDADVKKLYADGKHAEIEQARLDGRLNTYLGITSS